MDAGNGTTHRGGGNETDRERNAGSKELENKENTGEEEAETGESAMTKFKKIPNMPGQQEINEHMIHHIPMRTWCEFCRYRRGHDDAHAKKKAVEELAIPEIFIDYMYLKGKWPFNQAGDSENEMGMPTLFDLKVFPQSTHHQSVVFLEVPQVS